MTTRPDGTPPGRALSRVEHRDFGRFRTYAYDDQRPEPAPAKAVMPAGPRRCREGATALPRPEPGPVHGLPPRPGRRRLAGGQRWARISPRMATEGLGDAIHLRHDLRPAARLSPNADAALGHGRRADAGGDRSRGRLPPDTEGPAARPRRTPERNPATRPRPVGFGDNLDPTNNPAVVRAEERRRPLGDEGPAGKACADCHARRASRRR